MPELPEVETVVRTLERQVGNAIIDQVEIRYENILANCTYLDLSLALVGSKFMAYQRRGKYLKFSFSSGVDLYIHLRMEGKFYIYDSYEKTQQKHIHAVFTLHDGRYLCYHDTRKFGRFYLDTHKDTIKEIDKLGLEPFDPQLDSLLYSMLKSSSANLKSFLLDQSAIVGIGNIYANEICYYMGMHPFMPVRKFTHKDADKLLYVIRNVLMEAIENGGTTIRSYTSSLGVSGKFQLHVAVYGREGEACSKCGTIIKRITLQQRSCFYCSTCQRRGKRS